MATIVRSEVEDVPAAAAADVPEKKRTKMTAANAVVKRKGCAAFWAAFWETAVEHIDEEDLDDFLAMRGISRVVKLLVVLGAIVKVVLFIISATTGGGYPSLDLDGYIVLLVISIILTFVAFACMHFRLEPVCVLYFICDFITTVTETARVGQRAAAVANNGGFITYAVWNAYRAALIVIMIIAFVRMRRMRLAGEAEDAAKAAAKELEEEKMKRELQAKKRALAAQEAAAAAGAAAVPAGPGAQTRDVSDVHVSVSVGAGAGAGAAAQQRHDGPLTPTARPLLAASDEEEDTRVHIRDQAAQLPSEA